MENDYNLKQQAIARKRREKFERMIARGMSRKEIAVREGITRQMVERVLLRNPSSPMG